VFVCVCVLYLCVVLAVCLLVLPAGCVLDPRIINALGLGGEAKQICSSLCFGFIFKNSRRQAHS